MPSHQHRKKRGKRIDRCHRLRAYTRGNFVAAVEEKPSQSFVRYQKVCLLYNYQVCACTLRQIMRLRCLRDCDGLALDPVEKRDMPSHAKLRYAVNGPMKRRQSAKSTSWCF